MTGTSAGPEPPAGAVFRRRRFATAVLWFLGLAAVAHFLFAPLDTHFYYTSDAAKYVLLGRSIAQGEGYRSIWEIEPTRHRKYGPLLPLLIAPFSSLSAGGVLGIKITVKILAILAVVAWFFYFRRRKTGPAETLFILAAYVAPIHFFLYSEGPNPLHLYTLTSVVALLTLDKYFRKEARLVRHGLVAAASCLAAFFAKGNGVALIAAAFVALLYEAWHRRDRQGVRKAFFLAVVTALPVLIWMAGAEKGRPGYGYSYVSELLVKDSRAPFEEERIAAAGMAARVGKNAAFYAKNLLFPLENRPFSWLACYLLAAGIYLACKKKDLLLPAYFLFYMAVILIWPWQGGRMFLPIAPVAAFLVAQGLRGHVELMKRWRVPRAAWLVPVLSSVLAVVLTAGIGYWGFKNSRRIESMYDQRPAIFWEFLEACAAVRSTTAADATFYSSIAPAFHLYTERRVIYPPLTKNRDEISRRLRGDGVDYVVLQVWGNDFGYRSLFPYIQEHPESFVKIFENRTCRVYRVARSRP